MRRHVILTCDFAVAALPSLYRDLGAAEILSNPVSGFSRRKGILGCLKVTEGT